MHVVDLAPERRHIHNQVLDHRQVAEWSHRDMPMPFEFFTEGGAAGQLLTAVDRHRTRAANSRATGIAKRDTPIALVLDANQCVKHRHPAPDIKPDLLRMGGRIDFRIKSLNREGQAHRRYRRITIILSHSRKNFARGLDTSHHQAYNMYYVPEWRSNLKSHPVSTFSDLAGVARPRLCGTGYLSQREDFLGYAVSVMRCRAEKID